MRCFTGLFIMLVLEIWTISTSGGKVMYGWLFFCSKYAHEIFVGTLTTSAWKFPAQINFWARKWKEIPIKNTMNVIIMFFKKPSSDNYLERSIKEWLDGILMFESLLDVEQLANYFPHVLTERVLLKCFFFVLLDVRLFFVLSILSNMCVDFKTTHKKVCFH